MTSENSLDILIVCTTDRGQKISRPLQEIGVEFEIFSPRSIREVPSLLRTIQQVSPDVVVVDSFSHVGGTVALARILFSTPYVLRFRGDIEAEIRSAVKMHLFNRDLKGLINQVPRYIGSKFSILATENAIFVSDYLKNRYHGDFDNKETIHTPCFWLDESPDGGSIQPSLEMPSDNTVILTVTNFVFKQKVEGLIQGLDQISEVLEANEDLTYVVAGDGPYFDKVKDAISTLPGDIRLPGYISDIYPLFERADVFIHLSLLDGYPSTILEAYATNTPVIANDACGMSEQVIDGETGYLIDIEDPHELQNSLQKLVSSTELRNKYGVQGRDLVDETNKSERIGEQFKSYLQQFQ